MDKIIFDNEYYLIPSDTYKHLESRYPKRPFFIRSIKKIINYYKKGKRKISSIFSIKRKITRNEFMGLYIEDPDSINWKLRGPHLDIVTDNGKYKKVKDVINYLSSNDQLQSLSKNIKETNTKQEFKSEIHIDRNFWQTGNNFYINCVKYEFIKDVAEYNKVKCIKNTHINTYGDDYFKRLERMTDNEIELFLQDNPIEIRNGSVTGGRHRVFAMIGRIVNGKVYIPFFSK